MGVFLDLAEAINVAAGAVSGEAVASIQRRVQDWSFRNACADACQTIPELRGASPSDLRALFVDTEFLVAALGGDPAAVMSDSRAYELVETLLGHLTRDEVSRVGRQIADVFARKALEQAEPMEVLMYSELQQQGLHVKTVLDRMDQLERTGGPGIAPSPGLMAEAALKGPIEALGLSFQLSRAETMEENDPSGAAQEYLEIANSLGSGGWPGHEWIIKRRMAKALAAAGKYQDAGLVVAGLAWAYLDLGADFEVSMLRRELAELAREAPESDLERWAHAVSAGHNCVSDPLDRLEELARVVDDQSPADPYAADTAVLLCELAIATDQLGLVRERIDHLNSVATTATNRGSVPSLAIRLRICLADVTDDWSQLLSEVRKHVMAREDAALVAARHGRYLAWRHKPSEARNEYRRAIEIGVLAKLNEDASEWIHASRYIDLRYGPISDEINEAYRRIQALRMTGEARRLVRHVADPLESSLRAMQQEKFPAASESLRRYLRECVVAGHWGSEFDAHELLGDLFGRTGEREKAAVHYIRSGSEKKLGSLLGSGPFVDLSSQLQRFAPWERAATYRAFVAEADFVPDDQVAPIISAALADAKAVSRGEVTHSPAGPRLWESAIAAIGAFAGRASEAIGAEVLDLLEPLVIRDSGKYRRTDKDHMRALAALVRERPVLRERALKQLFSALTQGDTLASEVLTAAGDVLIGQQDADDGLKDLSMRGVWAASLMLAAKGTSTPSVRQHAEEALRRTLDRPRPTKGTVSFGTTLGQDSTMVSILPTDDVDAFATRVTEMAEDGGESDWNRAEALAALRNVANDLSPAVRRSLLERAMRFVTGEATTSQLDPELRQTPHRLSRFRIHLALGPLEVFGLQAAARLAQSEQEIEAVLDAAWSMTATDSDEVTHKAVEALSSINFEYLLEHQAILAGQPHPSLRALAAVLWAQDPSRREVLGSRLASDTEVRVRRTLAREIASRQILDSNHRIVQRLLADERYSVRRLLLPPV